MHGSGHLHELGDELVIVSHEPKKIPDLSGGGGGGPLCDSIYLLLISHYSLSRDDVPQAYNLSAE